MRQPKLTFEQCLARLRYYFIENNYGSASEEDREELQFSLKTHANSPEGRQRSAEWYQRFDAIQQQRIAQAEKTAETILGTDDTTIIRVIRDSSQTDLLKSVLIQTLRYSHHVLRVIVTECNSTQCWIALGHPGITIDDLKLVIANTKCSEFVRGEARALLMQQISHPRLSA